MRENRVLKWVLCVSFSRVEEISPRVWGVGGDYQMDVRLSEDLQWLDVSDNAS